MCYISPDVPTAEESSVMSEEHSNASQTATVSALSTLEIEEANQRRTLQDKRTKWRTRIEYLGQRRRELERAISTDAPTVGREEDPDSWDRDTSLSRQRAFARFRANYDELDSITKLESESETPDELRRIEFELSVLHHKSVHQAAGERTLLDAFHRSVEDLHSVIVLFDRDVVQGRAEEIPVGDMVEHYRAEVERLGTYIYSERVKICGTLKEGYWVRRLRRLELRSQQVEVSSRALPVEPRRSSTSHERKGRSMT